MPALLTDSAIKKAKPREKRFKMPDIGGLYLEVAPNGSKWWRFRYRFGGKEKLISLGVYPEISLKLARERRDNARRMIAEGTDPHDSFKQQQQPNEVADDYVTFSKVTDQWFALKEMTWSESYTQKMRLRRNAYLCLVPEKPFNELTLDDFLPILKKIEGAGKHETCFKIAQMFSQICRYGKLLHHISHNPLEDVNQLLVTPKRKHMAAILDPVKIGLLLADIDNYNGYSMIKFAIQIMPYVFTRSSELRKARWEEINFDKAEWVIPAERMKMRREHIVPLSRQTLELFSQLRRCVNGELCFPSSISKTRCISDMGLLNALRRMGYSREEMCIHGFRSIASTSLNEMGFRPDIIEVQLAHVDSNAVRAAYNRSTYMEERKNMMQVYADYLDSLKEHAISKNH